MGAKLTDLMTRFDRVETMPHMSLIKASNGWLCSIRDMGNHAAPLLQVHGDSFEDAQTKGIIAYFERRELDSLI